MNASSVSPTLPSIRVSLPFFFYLVGTALAASVKKRALNIFDKIFGQIIYTMVGRDSDSLLDPQHTMENINKYTRPGILSAEHVSKTCTYTTAFRHNVRNVTSKWHAASPQIENIGMFVAVLFIFRDKCNSF